MARNGLARTWPEGVTTRSGAGLGTGRWGGPLARTSMLLALCAFVACARDREAEAPTDLNPNANPGGAPNPNGAQAPSGPGGAGQPHPRPIAFPQVQLAPRSPAAPAASTTPVGSASASSADTTELYRAQDACLSSCDQFACMRIASAYRDGVGVPRDPLAGRRYAIHACLECGTPGMAIVDQCPLFGVAPTTAPKKK